MANLQFTPAHSQPAQPFEVILESDGRVQFTQGPEDEALRGGIVQALAQTQPFGAAWDADYRSMFILSGAAAGQVSTLEDVQGIAVPRWRRFSGEVQGNGLTITGAAVSADGESWGPFPVVQDASGEAQHPAFGLPGRVRERYFTLHWREGRIDIEPDPPGELLDVLEDFAGQFNGVGDVAWLERHAALGGPAGVKPDAKRFTVEVREAAPLVSPSHPPMLRHDGLEFWLLVPLEYSLDGKKWARYPVGDEVEAPTPSAPAKVQDDPQAMLAALLKGETAQASDVDSEEDDDGNPFGMLSSLFDMQSVPVTVHADGRVEWEAGAIDEEYAEALRQSILNTTGAGDGAAWQERMAELAPQEGSGAPQAVRLQVMKALLGAAPGMLDQSYAPTAVSMNGSDWVNLDPMLGLDDLDDDDFDGLDDLEDEQSGRKDG